MEGTLISLEGIDKSGKTTVIEGTGSCDGLKDRFSESFITKEPEEEHKIGKFTRELLSDESIDDMSMFFMFLAEHAQHVEEFVRPKYNNGDLIISDRYIDSRYAYQSNTIASRIDSNSLEWIKKIQENGWTIVPDKTIIIDIDVETSIERTHNNDREVFEYRDIQKKARETYLDMANQKDRYVIVDGERNPEQIIDECESIINDFLD